MMAGLYLQLLDAGFNAEYLDNCTLPDIDLFIRQLAEFRKKQKDRPRF